MPEPKFGPEKYRDELAKKLKEAPKEEREEILEQARKTEGYEQARKVHLSEKEMTPEVSVEELVSQFRNDNIIENPERVRESLKGKVFLVEDTQVEIEKVQKILGEDLPYASDLQSALEKIGANKEKYKYILTDLFYPVGNLREETKAEFYQKFSEGLEEAVPWESMKGSAYAPYVAKMREYFEQISTGSAEEVPSGILLSLNALLKNGQLSRIVSSEGHGSSKAEAVGMFLNGATTEVPLGDSRYNDPVKGQVAGLNGLIDTTSGGKRWTAAIVKAYLFEEGLYNDAYEGDLVKDKELAERERLQYLEIIKSKPQFQELKLVQLAIDLEKYY